MLISASKEGASEVEGTRAELVVSRNLVVAGIRGSFSTAVNEESEPKT